MALGISIPHPSGATASYWRVVGVALDAMAQTARITLAGYVSAETRASGCPPLDQRAFDASADGFAALAGFAVPAEAATAYEVVASAAYNLARTARRPDPANPGETLPGEFADAEDV